MEGSQPLSAPADKTCHAFVFVTKLFLGRRKAEVSSGRYVENKTKEIKCQQFLKYLTDIKKWYINKIIHFIISKKYLVVRYNIVLKLITVLMGVYCNATNFDFEAAQHRYFVTTSHIQNAALCISIAYKTTQGHPSHLCTSYPWPALVWLWAGGNTESSHWILRQQTHLDKKKEKIIIKKTLVSLESDNIMYTHMERKQNIQIFNLCK